MICLEDYVTGDSRIKMLVIGGPGAGAGSALAVCEKVATPTGWRRIGDIVIGDLVIGSNGKPTEVLGVHPQGRKRGWIVAFNDGSSVETDAEHQWTLQSRKMREKGRPGVVVTTQQMIDNGVRQSRDGHKARYNYFLPLVAPVQYDKIDLPIDPYLLGALLANGSLTSDVVDFSTNDVEIAERIIAASPALSIRESTREAGSCRKWAIHKLHPLLAELGIDRLLSADKHIPPLFLTAHEEARRELLAGLVDGDGSVEVGKRARYHTRSRQLAYGVQELVQSLGGVAAVRERERDAIDYQVDFWLPENPFRLGRKAESYRPRPWFRAVEEIHPSSESEDFVCLNVAASDELFVVTDYLVTHNTRMSSLWPWPIAPRQKPARSPRTTDL